MFKLIAVVGILFLIGFATLLSTDRKAINWRTILWGLGIQFGLALFILKTEAGRQLFQALGAGVTHLLAFSKGGAGFIFGKLVDTNTFGFIFAFQVLPTIIFVAAIIAVLYHLGIIQFFVGLLAKFMSKTMGTSGAESLSSAACVFVGQVEGPLLVKPYIEDMTRSELMALMAGGMSTIAGGVMAAYIAMLGAEWAPHLLAASIMGAPGGLIMAKLLVPETEVPKTRGAVGLSVEKTEANVIEAAAKGANDGLHLSMAVTAMLIAFIALVSMLNAGLGLVHIGGFQLSLEKILGFAFAPVAFLIGVPWNEAPIVGNLLGQKIVINEFVAYLHLTDIIKGTAVDKLSPHSVTIATFALCGFANLSSVAQNVGGIGSLAPSRRSDLARLGLRAMLAGAMASMLSAAIAGLLV